MRYWIWSKAGFYDQGNLKRDISVPAFFFGAMHCFSLTVPTASDQRIYRVISIDTPLWMILDSWNPIASARRSEIMWQRRMIQLSPPTRDTRFLLSLLCWNLKQESGAINYPCTVYLNKLISEILGYTQIRRSFYFWVRPPRYPHSVLARVQEQIIQLLFAISAILQFGLIQTDSNERACYWNLPGGKLSAPP